MRISSFFPFHLLIIIALISGCGGGNGGTGSGSAPKADHTTLDVSLIPVSALNNARALNMSLDHASVGGNIQSGMNALVTSNSARYSYPNWDWRPRGNPGWKEKVDQFVTWVTANSGSYDVFQMKFCFVDNGASFTYYRDNMLALEAAYPAKKFIWWTMPICTSGSENSARQTFNNLVRAYCAANNKPLFDIADIESHDASGSAVTESGYEAMAPAWSSDGGHLTSDGRLRVAEAMWFMMAEIAGWNP